MKQRDTLFIFISFFLLVLAWIAFSVYHTIATSTLSEALSVQISPIDPSFDTATLEKLKDRNHIDPLYQSTTSALPTVPPSPVPTETASRSALQSTQIPPTGTPSGQTRLTP